MPEVVKVSSKSSPNAVAGALAHVVRSSGSVEMQVVGAGALNQAVKAIAIARGFVFPSGVDLTCKPTFADVEIDGESRTAIRLLVETAALGRGSAEAGKAAVVPFETTVEYRSAEDSRPRPVGAPVDICTSA